MDNETITTNKPVRSMSYNRIENILGTTGKLTPQAVEFEEAVLGALMIDDNAVTEVLSILKPEMFYVEANQYIFSAIRKLFSFPRHTHRTKLDDRKNAHPRTRVS